MDRTQRLAADIFISELMLDGVLRGNQIRHMIKDGYISRLRDIYTSTEWVGRLEKKGHCISQQLRQELGGQIRKNYAQKTAEEMAAAGMFSFSLQDPEYPERLKPISGMPIILYGMGDIRSIHAADIPVVAWVGTRRPSMYGLKVTEEAVKKLCESRVCIVSGLARGIDTKAHRTTLREGGRTVAVMAGGLDQVYPPENEDLFKQIKETGCVLSELPPKRKPLRQFFPARNRILSGLSDAVVIAEAGEHSGALHTASYAASQGRDVFAVPGNIYSNRSNGCHMLLKDGAEIFLDAEDVLERLASLHFYRTVDAVRFSREKKRGAEPSGENRTLPFENEGGSDRRSRLLDCICSEDKSMDALLEELGMPFQETALILAELELSGRIAEIDGKYTYIY